MVYYVYLDPAVVTQASQHGDAGLSSLIGILRGLLANTCIADFDDERIRQEIGALVQAAHWPGCTEDGVKCLKMLLKRMENQRRFIPVFGYPDDDRPEQLAQHIAHNAEKKGIDAYVSPTKNETIPSIVEQLGLFTFSSSHFETRRQESATNGVLLQGGDHSSDGFFKAYFLKALKHAKRVEFVDRLFADKYADHFEYTTNQILRHISSNVSDSSRISVTIHSIAPRAEGRLDHCRKTTSQQGRNIQTEVHVYDETESMDTCLHHDRFLLTDQFAFEIGRGLDLFDMCHKKNRDVSVSFKDTKKVQAIIDASAGCKRK